jgi:hypothetical protein
MMSHDDYDHARTFQPDYAEPTSDVALVGLVLRQLLFEYGHYTADEEQAVIAEMQGAFPENGGCIVAHAWTDSEFKEYLLQNGTKSIKKLGFEFAPYEFTVMENTEQVHNVIVCMLCSCYPRALLSMSPTWYKSKSYRARVVRSLALYWLSSVSTCLMMLMFAYMISRRSCVIWFCRNVRPVQTTGQKMILPRWLRAIH